MIKSQRPTAATILTEQEYNALATVARAENTSVSNILRGLIIDFLVEQHGCHFVQRLRPKGRPKGGEGSALGGAAATGDNYWNNVPGARASVDVGKA